MFFFPKFENLKVNFLPYLDFLMDGIQLLYRNEPLCNLKMVRISANRPQYVKILVFSSAKLKTLELTPYSICRRSIFEHLN